MKVFIVLRIDCEGDQIKRVFATRELADRWIAQQTKVDWDFDVEEFDVLEAMA